MPETSKPRRVVHYTVQGNAGVCGANAYSVIGNLVLTFDDRDMDIDCSLCRMYVKGLHDGRNESR